MKTTPIVFENNQVDKSHQTRINKWKRVFIKRIYAQKPIR